MNRRWRWIVHVLRMSPTALRRVALRWTPDGCRKKERSSESWRRTVEKKMKELGWIWGYLERCATDRSRWRALLAALRAKRMKLRTAFTQVGDERVDVKILTQFKLPKVIFKTCTLKIMFADSSETSSQSALTSCFSEPDSQSAHYHSTFLQLLSFTSPLAH